MEIVCDQIRFRDHFGNQLWNQLGERPWDRLYSQLWDQARGAGFEAMRAAPLWEQLHEDLRKG